MRVISNKVLVRFGVRYPQAGEPLQVWRKIIECTAFQGFADLRRAFNTVDRVGDYYVFDIAGNKYRLIAAIHFNTQMLFVRHVLTHAEYDQWRP
ncbi:MAG: type II toxin-antitoxin system HigB family toxin [Pseudomonadota bacterium]